MLKNADNEENERIIYENYYKYIKKLITLINNIETKINLENFKVLYIKFFK